MTTRKNTRHTRHTKGRHRSTGRRLSLEQQQEYVSLDQCSARLSGYGWVRNELKRDHGEDVLIHIYENGASTGLTFLLQCKSTTDLTSLRLKKDPSAISYDLEVADLEHWRISASPVVVMVWDVRQQEGRWILVSDAIRQLDARSKTWQRRSSVAVHIPWDHGTDDHGLGRLRHAVADHLAPVIMRQHQEITITPIFSFPHTAEGKTAYGALQAFIDTGVPATIDGKFVKQFRMPEWWERLYGRDGKVQTISFGQASARMSIQCRLELDAIGFQQPVAVPYVELKQVRRGRKEMVLSNEHQPIPVHVRLTTRQQDEDAEPALSLSFDVDHAPPNPFEARDATMFSLALHSSQRIRLISPLNGETILEASFPGLRKYAYPREVLEQWHDLLNKLCSIHSRLSRFGAVRVPSGRSRHKDEAGIRRFYTICTTGEERATGTVSWMAAPAAMDIQPVLDAISACENDPSNLRHGITLGLPAGQTLRVANVTVPLGRIEVVLVESLPILRELADSIRSGVEKLKFEYKDRPVIRRYLDWLPGGEYASAAQ